MESPITYHQAYDQWLKLQPLTETQRLALSRRFTVDFNFNSNHIEGNTLTYGQTELLLMFGKVVGEVNGRDFEEMRASAVGLKMTEVMALARDMPLTQNFIRQLHKTLLREDHTVYRNLPGGVITSYVIHAGQYKTRPNSVISRTGERFEYASPEETPALMTDLVDWYNAEEERGAIPPVELAALFHYRYIRIHPFEDGNGRIARLMANFILSRHGYPMVVVRSRGKRDYLEALSKSDKVVGLAPAKGANATLNQARHFVEYFKKLVTEEIYTDVRYLTLSGPDIWWFDGELVQFKSLKAVELLHLIVDDPYINIPELSRSLGITRQAVSKQIERLTKKNYLTRPDNAWHLHLTPAPTAP